MVKNIGFEFWDIFISNIWSRKVFILSKYELIRLEFVAIFKSY